MSLLRWGGPAPFARARATFDRINWARPVPASHSAAGLQPADTPRLTLADVIALVALVALTLFHITAVLGWSMRHGRMAFVPTYDDAAYLVDGLERLASFDKRGFVGLFHSFRTAPPHSPVTTLLGTLGFALTPGSRIGSYLLDSGWVLLFLALAAALLRRLPWMTVAGVLIALLSVPAMGTVVAEFRPDLSWGLLTGFASLLLLSTDLGRTRKLRLALLGALLGLAILSKPTGFLPVLAVFGVAYLFTLAATLRGGAVPRSKLVAATVILGVSAGVVAIPYFIVGGRDIIDYIRTVMIDDKAIWITGTETVRERLTFYLRMSHQALGPVWPLGPILAGLAAALIVWRYRLSSTGIRALGVLALMFSAYAIPTAAPIKIFFFGFLFYGMILATSIWAIGVALRRLRPPPVLIAAIGIALFFCTWTPRDDDFDSGSRNIFAMNDANLAIAPAVVKVLAPVDPAKTPQPVVLNVAPGPIGLHILKYFGLLANVPGKFTGVYSVRDFESVLAQCRKAEVVVISDDHALGQSPANFPVKPYLERLVTAFKADPDRKTIASFTDKDGFHTYAFALTSMADAAGM